MARDPEAASVDEDGHQRLARHLRLTVFADLTVAVEVGMILAALLFIRRVAATTTVVGGHARSMWRTAASHILQDKIIPVVRQRSSASTDRCSSASPTSSRSSTEHLEPSAVVVVRLRNMTAIDATGLQALEELGEALHASGRTLVLCGAREQPAMLMQAAAFHQHVGERNICPNIEAALQRAAEIHRASAA